MITAQRKKQTYKQADKKTKKQKKKNTKQQKQTMKQTCVHIVLIQGNEKSLMKFAAVSAKLLKTVKCMSNLIFNIDIRDLCYFLFSILSSKDKWKVLQR